MQKAQFQEAMRIHMAMKQMPIDDGDMPTGQTGLRVKQPANVPLIHGIPIAGANPLETIIPVEDPAAFELTPPVFTP